MIQSAPAHGEVLLEAEGLSVSYGVVNALHGIDLKVCRGEVVTLLGANGAGKSSTLNALVGLAPRKAKRINFQGKSIDNLTTEMIVRAGMTLVPEGRRVFAGLTVAENLLLGGAKHGQRGSQADVQSDMLALFPILAERLHQKAGSLSGGEQQMLAIARALMSSPSLLLLDEPSLGLAPKVVETIFALIATLRSRGLTILLVEQNVAQSLEIADRGYVIVNGRIELSGTASELSASAQVRDAYLGT